MTKASIKFSQRPEVSKKPIPATILMFENDPDIASSLSKGLADEGYRVLQAFCEKEASDILEEILPDLVLMAFPLQREEGCHLSKKIREEERTKEIPIILLAANDEQIEKMRTFEAFYDDYIAKPFTLHEVLARIRIHLRLHNLKKELALSEKQYKLLIENSPDGILSISPKKELFFHNTRFVDILRFKTQEQLTGRSLTELFPISDFFREISVLIDLVMGKKNLVVRECQINTTNKGTIWLEVLGMPVTNEGLEIESYLVVIRDITQRLKIEEALIQAEKINSLGILTAGITHEITNPLTCISNSIQILKKDNLAFERKQMLCDSILENINRIVKIVKDLRIFSRPHSSISQEFSIAEVIAETLSLLHYQVKDGRIEIEFKNSSKNQSIFGDRDHFQQVLVNLLVNAIQAIKGTGKITVSLSREGNNAQIVVEDTGCGIPPDQLGQLFNPFFTTKRDWKGTGLGLAVSYRIVQLFRGTIKVQTAVGKGTSFTISIPLYKPKAEE